MLRKALIIAAAVVISVFWLSGCKSKKSSSESKPSKTTIKTTAKAMSEYDAKARKEINKNNIDEELNKLEKEINQDTQ